MMHLLATRCHYLKEVIAGGVLRDTLMKKQSSEAVHAVMAPKVHGSHNLWRVASKSPLQHFCGFSSVSSLMGSAGQSCYVAANNVLDSVVAGLHACGVPGEAHFLFPSTTYLQIANVSTPRD